MTKIVIQCSGGIDSTVLLGHAIKEFGRDSVFPIAFNSDAVFWHHRDKIAVKRVCTNFGLQHRLFECLLPQVDMFEYTRDDVYQDVGFIPGWKMLLNTASMAYAQKVGASQVWCGNMVENTFPDETPDHLSALEELYNKTYADAEHMPRVKLLSPYRAWKWDKADVIKHGVSIGVNVFDTVSCGDERLAGGFNCGDCPWCQRRKSAFVKAGVQDLTRYVLDKGVQIHDWSAWKSWQDTNTRMAQGQATARTDGNHDV